MKVEKIYIFNNVKEMKNMIKDGIRRKQRKKKDIYSIILSIIKKCNSMSTPSSEEKNWGS